MQKVLTNGAEIKSEIIEAVKRSSKSIKLAIAYFTDQDIAEALVEAHNKGVEVRIIVDDSPSNLAISDFFKPFAILKFHKSSNKFGIMHLKHNLIDDKILLHGTFNYTKNASLNNSETLYVTDDEKSIDSFSVQFDDLYSSSIAAASLTTTQKDDFNKINNNKMGTEELEFDAIIDSYTAEIENHVKSVFLPASNEEIKRMGFEDAESNNGATSSFISFCDQTLQDLSFEVNNSQQNISRIRTRISNCFENVKTRLNEVGELKINMETETLKVDLKKISDEKRLIEEKLTQNSQSQAETLHEIKEQSTTIDNLNQKISAIEGEFPVRPFWRFPIFVRLLFLFLFVIHLSLFFASAFYKIFLEDAAVKRLSQLGIEADSGSIYDLDAIFKLLQEGGVVFLISGTLFFIIPVVMTNIKLFKKEIKFWQEQIFFYVGILAFDIIVAFVISFHTHASNNLINGTNYGWGFSDAMTDPNFYLIFLFGALPLFLVKLLLPYLYDAYNNSSLELVNAVRFKEVNKYLAEINDIKLILNVASSKLEELKSFEKKLKLDIDEFSKQLVSIENKSDRKISEIKGAVAIRVNQSSTICQKYLSDIEAGNNIFLGKIVRQRLIPFKAGYIQYFVQRYTSHFADRFITELETSTDNWLAENFK